MLLGLLLANILVFAWHRWITPPDFSGPVEPLVPELVLAQSQARARAAPQPDAAVAVSPQASALHCITVGPFSEFEQAGAVRQQLGAAGYQAVQTTRQGRAWVGYWVTVEGLANKQEADETLARLAAAGMSDAYVVESDGRIRISLGVFRLREYADRVAGQAAALDLDPVTVDRYRPAIEYWLEIRTARTDFDLAGFQLETSQILRAEKTACPE